MATGTLLYPSRSIDVVQHEPIQRGFEAKNEPLVFAFGGTINSSGHVLALQQLALALDQIGATLNIYGPITERDGARLGLLKRNIRICGLVMPDLFIQRIRNEADVLFIPMSFAPEDRANMTLCFPSKLADYTAAGLPLLVYGPDYSSAVRWARENPGVAAVVDRATQTELVSAVVRLTSGAYRQKLAETAVIVGARLFSHSSVSETFLTALSQTRNPAG